MELIAEEKDIDDWIKYTLRLHRIKINSKSFLEYERAKEIIQQYYPDYYDRGMRIAREMIGI